MYAIIRAGGKQYKVAEQDVIEVNKLAESEGDEIVLDSVLLVSGEKGISIGTPYVEGAAVHYKGRKIRGFTYRAKKDYHRHYGHRQQLTSLSIEQIKLP